jgi:hypothetical protein
MLCLNTVLVRILSYQPQEHVRASSPPVLPLLPVRRGPFLLRVEGKGTRMGDSGDGRDGNGSRLVPR